MQNEKLYDISEVCTMLGISSRSLRFYEEKGLIESTKVFSNRRKYSKKQFELIKKILVLRSLGLSIASIQAIQKGDSDLKQAIIERKAEIIARIVKKSKEMRLLDDALNILTDGGDIFVEKAEIKHALRPYREIIDDAVDKFINGDYEKLFDMFTEVLKEYTPLSALKRIVSDVLAPLGRFISIDKITADVETKNMFYCDLRYEKLGLHIVFVLHGEKIHGFWLNYYEV